MARFISQTLIRTSSPPNSFQTTSLGLPQHRRFSSRSGKSQLIEVDLESDSKVEVLGLRKLEDAIHSIIVRQSAPDWLPFVPGSSYWVPPRRHRHDSHGIVSLLRKFSKPMTDEESMSLSSSRGWPSSNYFIQGCIFISSNQPIKEETVCVFPAIQKNRYSCSELYLLDSESRHLHFQGTCIFKAHAFSRHMHFGSF